MISQKKGLQFSFAWLFAIIVGAVIIFLAVYTAIEFTEKERYELDTVTAKQLSILFEPMETGIAEGKSNIARLQEETRINNDCYEGGFGEQGFSVATKQGIGSEWPNRPGAEININNKYIFSNSTIQTGKEKEVYFFSKPLKLPWKVAPLIFMTTKNYCFKNPTRMVEEDINGLAIQNMKVGNCSASDIKVCFSGAGDCDIEVREIDREEGYGVVRKDGEELYYTGNLIYGAIFSSKEIYECNVKRLMFRLGQQAIIYRDESNFLTGRCEALSTTQLMSLVSIANSVNRSSGLINVARKASEVNKQNEAAECELW